MPPPVRLWREERDGYRLEKWEFYPDDYAAVPFLVLIPEGASAAHPVPGVLCLPGSNHSKESLAGEPLPPHPEWPQNRFPLTPAARQREKARKDRHERASREMDRCREQCLQKKAQGWTMAEILFQERVKEEV